MENSFRLISDFEEYDAKNTTVKLEGTRNGCMYLTDDNMMDFCLCCQTAGVTLRRDLCLQTSVMPF